MGVREILDRTGGPFIGLHDLLTGMARSDDVTYQEAAIALRRLLLWAADKGQPSPEWCSRDAINGVRRAADDVAAAARGMLLTAAQGGPLTDQWSMEIEDAREFNEHRAAYEHDTVGFRANEITVFLERGISEAPVGFDRRSSVGRRAGDLETTERKTLLDRGISEVSVGFDRRSSAGRRTGDLETTERKTLLRMIFGMANVAYKFDPAASRNSATSEISTDTGLDDGTVLKWLRLAANEVAEGKR